MDLKTLQDLDADDEALVKYKAELLGNTTDVLGVSLKLGIELHICTCHAYMCTCVHVMRTCVHVVRTVVRTCVDVRLLFENVDREL